MRQYIDSAKVKRNARIARILSFGGLASMGLGLVISFQNPNDTRPVLGLFLVGILTSQIGQPMRNRWDRRPRIDELLDGALKGLDQRFAIFHYSLGARHLLICPGGVFALIPRGEAGKIEYNNGNWTRTTSRGSLIRRAGTRSIRGIEREADAEVDRANSRLDLTFSVRPMFVFIHSNAEMNVHQAPAIASHLKKLKSSIRRLPKAETLSQKQIALLAEDHGFA
ncbi:MAG: hypothetical protein QGM45_01615 [Anaerolineales bacterium]|nr:hypothetical protein [Anaerolineales bacterium]